MLRTANKAVLFAHGLVVPTKLALDSGAILVISTLSPESRRRSQRAKTGMPKTGRDVIWYPDAFASAQQCFKLLATDPAPHDPSIEIRFTLH